MKVESIVIVGGGSSGWMTAAMLKKTFPEMEIALIESENSKPIGVGESTLGHFNRFLRRLGLEDKDWMPHCNATYKTSIAFKNFRHGAGERFQYPFGNFDLQDSYKSSLTRFFELQIKYPDDYPPEEFARFVNQNTYLAEQCKIARDIPNSNYNFDNDTAYHFDAQLFGEYLRDNHCVPKGVIHLKGDVEDIIVKPNGDISGVMTTEGGVISADLFIDCTGFKSLLLEQHMGVEFQSFHDCLFNDRALATQIPYTNGKREQQMETYTDCVAMDNGWVWNIPLWHRVGTGYVYSSKYTTQHDAEREFREYLYFRYGPEIAQSAQMRPIKIKHGKHEKAWVNNVIGVGLAYGFLEPLESTGLMTTHENIIFLCDILERRNTFVSKFDRDTYNYKADNLIEAMKNFVSTHYTLSQREDNDYWSDCVNTVEYSMDFSASQSTIDGSVGTMNLIANVEKAYHDIDNMSGSIYIAAGLNYRPITASMYEEGLSYGEGTPSDVLEDAHAKYQQDREVMQQWVDKLPSHYEYLRDNIYGTDEYLQTEETLD